MEASITSTTGLIPLLLSLTGVLVALQYLKGMSDFSDAVRLVFLGFVCTLLAKILIFVRGSMSDENYYCASLILQLWTAVFLMAGSSRIRGGKFFSRAVIIFACLLAAVWGWYVVIVMRDSSSLILSMAASVIGYVLLAASLWRRKTMRNSVGFVITGWFCIFLTLFKLLGLMSWGRSLASPSIETFLYIAIMCGWILISNNLMAGQFDTLEQAAEESKERLRLMIQMSPFPIIISRLKDDQLMLINNKAGALFGLDVKHPGNFKTVDYFAEPEKRTELLNKLEKHPVVDDFEFLVKPRKGEPFWLLLSARVIDFEYEIALYMAFQDITDRKKKELQLFDQATRDPLTKCYNRRQFDELAKKEIQRSRRYNHPFCLFMIDADHFKNVNDTHGHAVGDLVLQALADCCRRTLRETDIVARFGGEEFVILLPESAIENAFRVAERLRIKISKLVVKNEQNENVQFTVSIGLVSSTVTDDIPEMLKMADESLYVAKENGRNQVVVYEATGPNKDLPRPEGEDIEKAKAEPLYFFKPSNAPVVMNRTDEEEVETGVVGLSGDKVHDESYLEDDEEDVPASQGVSLNSLYEDNGDDSFTPAAKPPEPEVPAFGKNEPAEEELPPEDVFSDDNVDTGFSQEELQGLPPDEEEPLPPEEELPPDEEEALPPEEELPPDEEEALPPEEELPPDEEDTLPPEEELPPDEEDTLPPEENTPEPVEENIEEDIPVDNENGNVSERAEKTVEKVSEPIPPSIAALPVEKDDIPPLAVNTVGEKEKAPSLPVASPVAKAPMVKMPVLKKVPIKIPPGMVKIPKMPKMPGVIRVKIPKPVQKPVAPKPTDQQ